MNLVVILYPILLCVTAFASGMHSTVQQTSSMPSLMTSRSIDREPENLQEKKIRFVFNDEPLVDIIYLMAEHKDFNIVVPSGAGTITSKITVNMPDPMSIDDAWDMFLTILDVAGYSIIPKGGDLHMIVPNNKNITRESVPLYIGVKLEDLPATDERIRVLHFLSNLKASISPDSEIPVILKEMLTETASYQIDEKTNSILVTGKARDIKEVLEIIQAFEDTSFREKLEIVQLTHTSADTVALLFNNLIQDDRGANRYRLDAKKETEASYFSKNVKVIAEKRLNKLFLLGKEQAVVRMKDFIRKHIDVAMDSGKSILHVHQLQYLDAAAFAKVLESIVDARRSGGAGQSTGAQAATTERFFEGVIIQADKPTTTTSGYFGGNKLIIAAKNDDWQVIKGLIETLDQPQPQVIIEVLIADLTINQTRALANMMRNPAALPVPGTSSFQSAQIANAGIILDPPISTDPLVYSAATNMASDLLGNATSNPATQVPAGSTILSINDQDGRTWSITQLLQRFRFRKVISHPHVVATNNTKANITIGETRLLPDEAVASSASTTVPFREQQANLSVTITPRISSSDQVNLNIVIDITEFLPTIDENAPPRATRTVNTSANVRSGDILALGGLLRTDTARVGRQVPLLGSIPLFGWLTKGRNRDDIDSNLTVFISPIIVPARLRGGAGEYTKAHISIIQKYAAEGQLYDSLRDPITRFFFENQPKDHREPLSEFLGLESATKGDIPGVEEEQIEQVGTSPLSHDNPLDDTQNSTEGVVKTPSRKQRLGDMLAQEQTMES